MPTLRLKTDLRCVACVAKVKPLLDAEPSLASWSADVEIAEKVLTLKGDNPNRTAVEAILNAKGYRVLGEIESVVPIAPTEKKTTYFPLLLILCYLLAGVSLLEFAMGSFDPMRAMRHFMAGFFLVFSFFKLLNLQAFADAYTGYDLLAKAWKPWGLIYPFVELGLGCAYLAHFAPMVVNWIALIVMGLSTAGVLKAVLTKSKIRCACLGTVFNLPMSTITLVEDLLMVLMAAGMLVAMAWR